MVCLEHWLRTWSQLDVNIPPSSPFKVLSGRNRHRILDDGVIMGPVLQLDFSEREKKRKREIEMDGGRESVHVCASFKFWC